MTENLNLHYTKNNLVSDNNSDQQEQQSQHTELIILNKSALTTTGNSPAPVHHQPTQLQLQHHNLHDVLPDGMTSSSSDEVMPEIVVGMDVGDCTRNINNLLKNAQPTQQATNMPISNGLQQQSSRNNQSIKQEIDDQDEDVGDGGGGGSSELPCHNFITHSTSTATSSHATTPKLSGSAVDDFQQNKILGRLISKDNILLITEHVIEIGRNSSKSTVHFNVGRNSFVSRKHLEIHFNNNEFYLICLSKNGVMVDDVFTRKCFEQLKLPKTCNFRFPSTNIRIVFENLLDENLEPNNKLTAQNIKNVDNSNVIYKIPLKISIPEERKSPYPSPTGTISAANSCPTSPRQGFHDYTSYSNSNHNNNNNNFQNDMFHPPSTSYGEHEKPPYSYAQLIVQSISASPEKQLTLSGIYSFISKNYPYYRTGANKGWQNSIRHNLSLNRYFIKVPRSQDEPGKGSFWRIDPTSEMKLIDQSYRKRRQRGSQCFRSPFGMPRSAPVSPSHIDNSRENSPLHDITMQSAPGSPGHYHNNFADGHIIEETANSQGTSYNSNQYNYCSSSVKREHQTDPYDDSEDYDTEEYDNIKRPKNSND